VLAACCDIPFLQLIWKLVGRSGEEADYEVILLLSGDQFPFSETVSEIWVRYLYFMNLKLGGHSKKLSITA
jgi:hypothetical protein